MSFALAITAVCLQIAAVAFAFSAGDAPMAHVQGRDVTISITLAGLALIAAIGAGAAS